MFYSGSKESFFQKLWNFVDRGDLPPQLTDSRWLLDLAFLTGLTSELNEFNTELQGENMIAIKIIGIINSQRNTDVMEDSADEIVCAKLLPRVQSRADGIFDASVCILCIDKLLMEFERMFKDSERTKFTVSHY
jgi:hypothetical protein